MKKLLITVIVSFLILSFVFQPSSAIAITKYRISEPEVAQTYEIDEDKLSPDPFGLEYRNILGDPYVENHLDPDLPEEIRTRILEKNQPFRKPEYTPPTPEVIAKTRAQAEAFDCSTVTDVPQIECEALVELYASTNGAGWKFNNYWLSGTTVGSWWGVFTNLGHVRSIDLNNNQLTGSIPPQLGNLQNLQDLSLNVNQLTGSIPTELANLSSLRLLNLSSNLLNGSISPGFGNLLNFGWLYLNDNQLSGVIPTQLGNLINLTYLSLGNNLLSGSIPSELGNLINLVYLSLENNELTGPFPSGLCYLTNLEHLSLGFNQLTGPLPVGLANLTNLSFLNLGSNQLTGNIPSQLGNLTKLTTLYLTLNHFTGNIPVELANLANLEYLDLGANLLTGAIPPQLGSLNRLWVLGLYSNQLSGSIPSELGNLTNLQFLYLSDNQLTSSIPSQLGNLTNLYYLDLGNNQLSGSIPSGLANLSNLQNLVISDNQLSGPIPPQLGNLTNLVILYLDTNQLSGSIPPQLGNLPHIFDLKLNNNQLNGEIPTEISKLTHLLYLHLEFNQFSGSIPLSFTQLTILSAFSFFSNDLCEPNTPGFLAWKETVTDWQGTGLICILPEIPFQPNQDGYSFQNWASITYSDYTYADVVRMFGAEAACWSIGPVCVLKPYAELFNYAANLGMYGGHCLGMAVTSSRFYKGLDLHTGFDHAFDLSKESSVNINWLNETFSSTARRNISYFHVMQATEPIASNMSESTQKTPSEFLSELSAFIADSGNDYPILFIYNSAKTGGHAVTPYAIEDQGDGMFLIRIYDNNYPADSGRKITINQHENTWSYYGDYNGNATSHNIGFVPISLFAQRPQCFWCESSLNSTPLIQLNYEGSGEFLITNSLGNRLGYQDGVFYDEIPGAFANPHFGGLQVDSQPIFYLPVSDEYDITIDGAATATSESGSLVTFGPGYAVQIAGITTGPSTFDEISISTNGTAFTYQPNQSQQVDVGLYVDTDTASWQLQTGQVDIAAGQKGFITVDPAQKILTVNNLQNASGDYNLFFKRVSDYGTMFFAANAIDLPAAVTHSIHFEGWLDSGTAQLDVDTDGDGNPEETIFLDNQMKYLFLPIIKR